MEKLEAIISYILKHYPYKQDLSRTRVTKMVFLSDWYHTQDTHHQMTQIEWTIDEYGPYNTAVVDAISQSLYLETIDERSPFGTPLILVQLKPDTKLMDENLLSKIERKSIDKMISDTKELNYTSFINFVNDTYAVKPFKNFDTLDLHKSALREKNERGQRI